MVKVLMCSTNELSGGAAVAANRITKSINVSGNEILLAVQKKESNLDNVFVQKDLFGNKFALIRKLIERIATKPYTLSGPFSTSLFFGNKSNWINSFNVDLVNLNWINNGFLSIEDIIKINKPLVWTLHDMWAFTGGCHYAGDCKKYKTSCGKCPILNSSQVNDLSRKVFEAKKVLSKKNITFVCPSKWIANCVKQSALFKGSNVFVIPYPINQEVFKPYDKIDSRIDLGLPRDKKIILFGAVNANSDKRKGYLYLEKALLNLNEKDKKNYLLVVFGGSDKKKFELFGVDSISLGQINSEKELAKIYSSADVFVLPSLEDNLPNTVIESLSCGLPVVGFNVGGVSDMIIHKKNGYLATLKDTEDLLKGIQWVLKGNSSKLSKSACSFALNNFNEKKIAKDYLKVYKKILGE